LREGGGVNFAEDNLGRVEGEFWVDFSSFFRRSVVTLSIDYVFLLEFLAKIGMAVADILLKWLEIFGVCARIGRGMAAGG
jgi:hypothetical protein